MGLGVGGLGHSVWGFREVTGLGVQGFAFVGLLVEGLWFFSRNLML